MFRRESLKYFICENWGCGRQKSGGLFSRFKNTRCNCGKLMNREISLDKKIHEGSVNGTEAFTISDDLKVMPSNLESSVVLLKNLGIEDMGLVEEMTVKVDQKEVVDLLKCTLLSKTPLTDFFLRKKEVEANFEPNDLFTSGFEIGKVPSQAEGSMRTEVKIMLRKSKSKVLFAQAEADFADFLLSFLTIPLGGILNLLQGKSGLISLDNLYKSLADLHACRHLKSKKIKNMLIKPQITISPEFKFQILPVDEATTPNYSCYSGRCESGKRKCFLTDTQEYIRIDYEVYAPLTLLHMEPKSSSVDPSSPGGFAKGPSIYMVTDDLVVTPISSISVTSFLNKSKIPLHDMEERVLSIGLEEGLSILSFFDLILSFDNGS